MRGIFISYRRQETAGYAGRLHAQLASHFGEDRVFMDVEGIEPGVDFVEEIERAVASCEVLIVIIGTGWLAVDSAGKRRLDDPKDFVHIETAAALARHIRVVPVLVDGAAMPRTEDLPADLAPLARRQAVELSNKHWDATSAELIRTLERILDGDAPLASLSIKRGRGRFWAMGGLLALAAAGVGVYLSQPWREPMKPSPQAERAPVAPAPDTVASRQPEKTAPVAEKSPALVEKEKAAPETPAAPTAEKAATQATEKAAASAPEKAAPPTSAKAAAPPAKTVPAPTTKPAAPTTEKSASSPKEKSVPSPTPPPASSDDKGTAAAPPPSTEKPSAPVAVAPAATPPAATPVAPTAALPPTLPRVGDSWEYRWRSKWPTVPPRTYTHVVTAVSAREVTQAISVGASADPPAARQSLTPGTRWVEWRGQGFYLLELNPFLEAFGGLQNAAAPDVPSMPADDPLHGNWYGRTRMRGYESVTVPAGSFKALKVEIDSNRQPTESLGGRSGEPTRTLLTIWYAPEVKRTVKMLRIVLNDEGKHLDEDTYELVKYRVQ